MTSREPILVLFDGHGIIHRGFHAFKQPLVVRRTGEVTTVAFAFANTLIMVLEQLKPTHIGVALDAPGPTFRHEADVTYKATRVAMPDDLRRQLDRVRELIDAFGIPVYELPGYEADDVLGTLACQAADRGIETYVVTLDTDLIQLVRPHLRVYMFRPYQRDTVTYDEERVRERYGFDPPLMADFKGLKGDASDNIPGVPGIGEKTAQKLIEQFGPIERIYEHLDEVIPEKLRETLRRHETEARHSKQMATIVCDAPVDLDLERLRARPFDRQRVLALFHELEFRTLADRLPESLGVPEPEPRIETPAPERDYAAITSEGDLRSLVSQAGAVDRLALHVQTTDGPPMRARILGIALSLGPGHCRYVPVGHRAALDGPQQLPLESALAILRPLLEEGRAPVVAHDGKRHMVALATQGITMARLDFDTMVAAYLLGRGGIDLRSLAYDRLKIELPQLTELVGRAGPRQPSLAELPFQRLVDHASLQADIPGRLEPLLRAQLQAEGLWRLFSDVEMPLVPVLGRMELTGMAMDSAVLREMSQALAKMIGDCESRLYETVGHQFNIGSPQQLSHVLFEELGLPKTRRTKLGYTTDATALEGLRGAHPCIDLILEYRQLTKLKSTYVDALPGLVDPRDNRIHTTFNQTVAATGRLSSNDPNLQNIPVRSDLGNQIRRAFIARDFGPDPVLLAADYSQIELRIMAHLSGDPALIESFRRDEDIHNATAASVFGVAPQDVTPEMRRRAKVFNFGVLYGLSEFGLSSREGISREEAADFIERYFARYPKVREWREEAIQKCRERGYAETLSGRRRYVPEIHSPNAQVRAAAERIAINMPVQGTAADIIKIAMNRIDAEIRDRRLRGRMVLQVHDELIFECPAAEVDAFRDMALRLMPASLELVTPLKVDVKLGKNWGELEVDRGPAVLEESELTV